MLPHSLTNFEIQKYYQNEARFNGVYCRNNLPKKVKDGAYVINLMNMHMLAHIWKLCISMFLVLNRFLTKLKNLLGIKT